MMLVFGNRRLSHRFSQRRILVRRETHRTSRISRHRKHRENGTGNPSPTPCSVGKLPIIPSPANLTGLHQPPSGRFFLFSVEIVLHFTNGSDTFNCN